MHKHVARLLIRMYPRQWRERYADEFAALLDDGGLSYRTAIDGARGAGGEWGRLVLRRLLGERSAALAGALMRGIRRVLLAWVAAAATAILMRFVPAFAAITVEGLKGHGELARLGLSRVLGVWEDECIRSAMTTGVIGAYALCISGPVWALGRVGEPHGRSIWIARGAGIGAAMLTAAWLWDWHLATSIGVGAFVISRALFPGDSHVPHAGGAVVHS